MQDAVRKLQEQADELVKQIDSTIENETDEDRIDVYQIVRGRIDDVSYELDEIADTEFPDYIFW